LVVVTTVAGDPLPPLIEHGSVPRSSFARIVDVWNYRELLTQLVRRELKVRYKGSVLGFFWTLLNPLLYLAIFSFVFGFILPTNAPRYGLLLLSALLAWNLFSSGLQSAALSIVSNGALVQRVWFPREILPVASVLASLVNFFFQSIVLLSGLAIFGQQPAYGMLWLLIPAVLAALLLSLGFGLMLGGLNVYYRDVGHFLELGIQAWFWLTPIVYLYNFMAQGLIRNFGEGADWLVVLNPMTPVVITFKRVLYNPENFSVEQQNEHFASLLQGSGYFGAMLLVSLGVGVVSCIIGLRVFARLEGNFGEEL
jgi:ABC-2 type transport system permease protein